MSNPTLSEMLVLPGVKPNLMLEIFWADPKSRKPLESFLAVSPSPQIFYLELDIYLERLWNLNCSEKE